MNARSVWVVCLALGALIALSLAFLLLPEGWNLIPLAGLGALVVAAVTRLRHVAPAPRTSAADEPGPERGDDRSIARRANRAFGPVVAGLIIDLVDFATFGPVGLVLGFPIGGLAGYWMGRALGLNRKATVCCALAAGIYCTIPGTEFIPLATIVGACVRFQESATDRG